MNSPTITKWESLKSDRLLSLREIQDVIGHDVTTLRRWVKEKRIRACRVGGQIRIRQSAVLALMKDLGEENGESV